MFLGTTGYSFRLVFPVSNILSHIIQIGFSEETLCFTGNISDFFTYQFPRFSNISLALRLTRSSYVMFQTCYGYVLQLEFHPDCM